MRIVISSWMRSGDFIVLYIQFHVNAPHHQHHHHYHHHHRVSQPTLGYLRAMEYYENRGCALLVRVPQNRVTKL